MAFEFRLPDVGEGVAEGELVRWLVAEGDEVSEDQPLAEVETDKAMVEVPSPVNGTVSEMRAEEGELVPVGDIFVVLQPEGEEELDVEAGDEASDEAAPAGGADAAEPGDAGATGTETGPAGDGEDVAVPEGRVFAAPSARRLARELGVTLAAVEGSGPSGRITERDVREHGGEPATAGAEPETGGAEPAGEAAETETIADSEPASGAAGTAESAAGAATTHVESVDRDRTLAVPATRRVAEELGVDLDAVPTDEERDGEAFVTEGAVRQYAQAQQEAQVAQAEAVAEEPTGERVERVPYRGVRRTIGDAMVESKFSAPHVTHHETAVVENLVETRERLKPQAEERGIRLTYMPFVMKAVVAALKQHPKLNAELDEEAGEVLRKNYYHIGVAAATEAGLMVPVVDDVDGKGMLQISSEVNELVQKARDRSISPDELQGSTFTITNFGAIGGEYATPILNYPEVAILGIGELKQRPVVEDGEVVARWTLPISISIDHRVVDGADVAQFASTFIDYVENPELLLLE